MTEGRREERRRGGRKKKYGEGNESQVTSFRLNKKKYAKNRELYRSRIEETIKNVDKEIDRKKKVKKGRGDFKEVKEPKENNKIRDGNEFLINDVNDVIDEILSKEEQSKILNEAETLYGYYGKKEGNNEITDERLLEAEEIKEEAGEEISSGRMRKMSKEEIFEEFKDFVNGTGDFKEFIENKEKKKKIQY